MDTESFPSTGTDTPSSIASTAPREAPEEIPSTYGSASGFLVKACMPTPESVSAAPINAPSSTRGALRNQTMFCVLSRMSGSEPACPVKIPDRR